MDYINKIETLDVGGGESVDFVRLKKGGRVIGINDESVVIYRDWQHWLDGDCEEMIWLSKPEPVYSAYWGIGYGEPKCESLPLSWFTADRNYTPENWVKLRDMELGDKLDLSDGSGEHFVVRIK